MKFIVDMNLSPRWVARLRAGGHEALHWVEVGAPNASDVSIMEWARERGFAVMTHDLDFGVILAATGGHAPSVLRIRAGDLSVAALEALVSAAIDAAQGQLLSGALVTVDARQHRVRLLPITPREPEGGG